MLGHQLVVNLFHLIVHFVVNLYVCTLFTWNQRSWPQKWLRPSWPRSQPIISPHTHKYADAATETITRIPADHYPWINTHQRAQTYTFTNVLCTAQCFLVLCTAQCFLSSALHEAFCPQHCTIFPVLCAAQCFLSSVDVLCLCYCAVLQQLGGGSGGGWAGAGPFRGNQGPPGVR